MSHSAAPGGRRAAGEKKMCRYTKRSHARAARGFLAPNPGLRPARGLGWAVGELEVGLFEKGTGLCDGQGHGTHLPPSHLLEVRRIISRPEGLIGRGIRAVLDSQPLVRVILPPGGVLPQRWSSGHHGGRVEQGSKLQPCQRVTTPDTQ